MPKIKLSKYTYGGRSCFELPEGRYYLISRHKTKGGAQKAHQRLDSPSQAKVRKYGALWLVLGVQTAR